MRWMLLRWNSNGHGRSAKQPWPYHRSLDSRSWNWWCWVSHPGSRKQNWSLHTCAQDVQITHTANNMVNRYNTSLNYKLESLQNDPWVQKKYYRVTQKSKRRCVFHRHNRRRGRSSLYLWLLLVLLVGLPHFVRRKATIEASLSRLMIATQQVGENMTWRLSTRMTWLLGFDLQKAVVISYALINLVNK
jgi:hypothetical protein